MQTLLDTRAHRALRICAKPSKSSKIAYHPAMVRLKLVAATSAALSLCAAAASGCGTSASPNARFLPSEDTSLCHPSTALRLSQAQLYSDEIGRWSLIGEVINPHARPVQFVIVHIAVRTSPEAPLQTEQQYAATGVMANGRIPFRLLLRLVGIRSGAQVSVAACSDDERLSQVPLPDRYRALALEEVKIQITNAGSARVTGRVRNVGSSDANKIRVVIGLYDATRQLVGVAEASVTDLASLTVGSAVSFTATTNRVLGGISPEYLLGVVEGAALSSAEAGSP